VGAVGTVKVVESEVGAQVAFGLHQIGVAPKIKLLVFDRALESLDEDVVRAPAATVDRDIDAALPQHPRELHAGKLTALGGVKYLRLAMRGERGVKHPQTKTRVKRLGQLPSQHKPAVQVDHCAKISVAALHQDIRGVAGLNQIGAVHGKTAQQRR